jgi:hypothetical protein
MYELYRHMTVQLTDLALTFYRLSPWIQQTIVFTQCNLIFLLYIDDQYSASSHNN